MQFVTKLAFALVSAVVLFFPGAAAADERTDLVKQIIDAQLAENTPVMTSAVSQMTTAMNADRAGLTADERRRLEAGLRTMLQQTVTEMLAPILSDATKFSLEDLRAVAAFNATEPGRKWNGLSSATDLTSPEAKQKVAAALLRNIEPAILVKLFSAQPTDGSAGNRRP